MEVSEEAVPLCFPVSENELVVLEEMCRLADYQLMELFYLNQREMVLERVLYSLLSESWTTL